MKNSPAQRKHKAISKIAINRSVRKNFFRIGLVLVVFFVSLTLLFSYYFYKYLNQKFASASSYSSYSISDDQIPTVSYIVAEDLNSDPIVIKRINFILFNKENKKVSIYDISVDSDFSLPGKFGNEILSKVFALGGLNSENRFVSGAEAVNRSIFKLFGFKVDRFLLTDLEHSGFFDNLWRGGGVLNYKNIKDVSSIGEDLKTNLDIREFYELMSFVNSLPKDRVVDEKNIPENFQNTERFDSYIKEFTYESPLAKEQKNIAVLNGTNYRGLASFGARVINNYGGRVVASSSSSRTYDKSVIITDDLSSNTTNFLSRVFKIENILPKEQAGAYLENEVDRSDVVIIFGFDTSGDLY